MNFPIQKLNSVGVPVPISLLDDAFGIVPCKGANHRSGKRYSEGLYTCSHCRLPLAQQVVWEIIERSISPLQAVASTAPVQGSYSG